MKDEWQEQVQKATDEGWERTKLTGRVRELEEKISVLLSCKNCLENKGGLICAKEYENKCLAQKIEYIKELQKENAELDMKRKAERKIFQGIVEKKNEELRNNGFTVSAMTEQQLKVAIGKGEQLERENAELKKQQITLRNERNTFLAQNEQYEKDLIDFNEQLTKAKEIIKNLLILKKDQHGNTEIEWRVEVTEQAEQFLKEIEK